MNEFFWPRSKNDNLKCNAHEKEISDQIELREYGQCNWKKSFFLKF